MSRKLQKYKLKYQFLEMELEDTLDFVAQNTPQWSELFGKYTPKEKEVWINEETGEVNDIPEPKKKDKPKIHPSVKKLYRNLSKVLHPDKGGDREVFDKAKKLYDKNDILGLVAIAEEYSIEVDTESIPDDVFDTACKSLQDEIGDKRQTILWKYFNGDSKAKLEVVEQLENLYGIEINREELDLS